MKLKEIKMSVHRKYTKDYQSYGFRIGIMYDVEGAEPMDAHREVSNTLKKMTMNENEKTWSVMKSQKGIENKSGVKEVGVKDKKGVCEICGALTINDNYKFCRECYFKQK
jgi:hypothetical protein